MNLEEFRKKYPLRPHDICWLRGAEDKVLQEVECISFPFEDGEKIRIKIRLTPNDPSTIAETDCSNLIYKPKKVKCARCNDIWTPHFRIQSAFMTTSIQGSRQPATICNLCGRMYSFVTDRADLTVCLKEEIGKWMSDRPLTILE